MNKKGFISISVVYTFFLVFIAIILGIIAMYANRRIMILSIKDDVRRVIDQNTHYNCFSKGITKLNECIIETYGGEEAIKSQVIPNFKEITAVSEYGLYVTSDLYGDSYYFRGNVPDNYVKFGQDYNGYDMYWRIVRINGDGSIRLIYDYTDSGTATDDTSSGILNDEAYSNQTYDNYVRFSNSVALSKLNDWYETNLKDYYVDYLTDNVFCNDTSASEYTRDYNSSDSDYENNLYKSFNRLKKDYTPSLSCNPADAYTVNNSKLTYPIGLLTADEVALAGGLFEVSNISFYLYTGYNFWTMTPYDKVFGTNVDADMWYVSSSGVLQNFDGKSKSNEKAGIRPVINLVSNIEIKRGNGTIDNPYVIEEVGY